MSLTPSSDYRLATPVAVRMSGLLLAVAGLAVALAAVLVAALDAPRAVLSTVVVLAVLTVLAAALLVLRRVTVVRLDEQGYRVRLVRGVGVAQGRWKDVEDVVATRVEGDRCVVLRRRDGSTTTIPVDLIDVDSTRFVHALQQHLNRGHGYRPVG